MTLPDYSGGSGFYDPGRDYRRNTVVPGYTMPAGSLPYQIAGTNDPEAAYFGKLAQYGLTGVGSRAQAAQGLLSQFRRGYGAAKLNSNFELQFPEYLDQANVMDTFNNLSYEQQGLDPNRFQKRYRWQFRPGG